MDTAYNKHPIILLDPSEYNAEHKNYTSLEDAKRAYHVEKQQIISCYERQFSIALKQIEYLEDYRKQQNKHNQTVYKTNTVSTVTPHALIAMEYGAIIDKLNRKISIMHDDIVNIKNLYLFKIDIMCREQLVEMGELKNKNMYFEKRLRAANIQSKILIKKQRDETFLKAKKNIQTKKLKQIADQEFQLQLEEIQINKDIVINRLAQEYHQIASQEEENKEKLDTLSNKLSNIQAKHQTEMSQLTDEYVSRIHYHRGQIQEYLNNNISININNKSQSRSHSRSQSPANYYNYNINNNNMKHMHLSESSQDSQSSAESAEIVTSLVIGIDEKLDDLLTPAHFNYNHSTSYSQHFNIRFSNDHDNENENDDDEDEDGSNDENELTPEPLEPPQPRNPIKYNYDAKRSNASLLFASPLISLVNNEDRGVIDKNEYNQLLQQCAEYEDTMKRYEGEIKELQEALDEMLSKNEFQEAEIGKLKEKNTKAKRKEFDWVTKEREYKSLLSQYRELRESNAKLTLTYFTLQCEYDKLKRDFDRKSAMIMNYGDYQINLTNQINHINQINLQSLYSNNSNDSNNEEDSDQSDGDDDDVDMVVGFMQKAPLHNHENNMSYFGNNIAFQYTAKTKDELIEDVLKLRDKLSEMTDTKFSILQSTKQEIDRLTQKVKMLEENNNNNNDNYNDSDDNYDNYNNIDDSNENNNNHNGFEVFIANQSRKSFGGNIIGIMNNDKHTYTVSRSDDLDSVVKQATNRQHQRAQSMANSKYLLPTTNHNHHNTDHDNNQHHIIDEKHDDA